MLAHNTISRPNDPVCNASPNDTVQSLKWAPSPQNLLCAGGWDNKASIWEISNDGQNAPKSQVTLPDAILSVSWKTDLSSVFLGCCDRQVKLWDLQKSQVIQVGQHNETVREVIWCEQLGMVISGGWDNTIAFWDGRQQQAVAHINVPGRVFGMSLSYPLLVAILSEKQHAAWNLEKVRTGMTQPVLTKETTLRYQLRSCLLYTSPSPRDS